MSLLQISTTPALVAPVLLGAFDGWIDAAGAASAAAHHLAEGGDVIASFDGDAIFDYRARRPVLDVIDGKLARLLWPEITIRRVTYGGRDLLVLAGPEPDFRWKEMGETVTDLALRLGVVQWVSLGAIPAAVAHTRPVPILGTASGPGLLRDDVVQGPQGLLRVPAAALSVVEMAVAEAGIPAVGFFAQVPNYVGGPYSAATIALLEHVARHMGVDLPFGDLTEDAISQRSNLDDLVAAQPDAREYLQRLEEGSGQDVPSGDELASEIERFLREQGTD